MYGKTTSRKVKGGEVRYLHLAHNEWDAAARRSVPKVLYSFGREDQLDREAVRRLIVSLVKLLDPADALAATTADGLVFTRSRPYGGAYVLDALWHRLGIDAILAGLRAQGLWGSITMSRPPTCNVMAGPVAVMLPIRTRESVRPRPSAAVSSPSSGR
jgi:hypothetical protein